MRCREPYQLWRRGCNLGGGARASSHEGASFIDIVWAGAIPRFDRVVILHSLYEFGLYMQRRKIRVRFTSWSSRLRSSRDVCRGCNIPSALRRFGGNAMCEERRKWRAGPVTHWPRLVRSLKSLRERQVP